MIFFKMWWGNIFEGTRLQFFIVKLLDRKSVYDIINIEKAGPNGDAKES